MTNEERKELLSRYLDGSCTSEEKILVENWYKDMTTQAADPEDVDFKAVEQAIAERLGIAQPKYTTYKRLAAAAAILIVIGTSIVFWVTRQQSLPPLAETVSIKDVPPGGNRAVLTLSNGQQVILDTAKSGAIAQQGDVTVTKNIKGQLVYKIQPSLPAERNSIAYNTITTPRGGQFEVILPDGSKVILNAASSLRYPTHFRESERTVTLTGEAYFDVKRNPQQPFRVVSSRQAVKVLGTHFNVCCYSNEPIETTLEEGKIEISHKENTQKTILKPGDQSIVGPNGIKVQQVDVEGAIAWKDGLFVFNHSPLRNVLQQLGRWYDVDVDFNNLPEKKLDGEIPRSFTLLQVLNAIEQTSGVKLTIKERRIAIQ